MFNVVHNITDTSLKISRMARRWMIWALTRSWQLSFSAMLELRLASRLILPRSCYSRICGRRGNISPSVNTPTSSESVSKQNGVTAEDLVEKLSEIVEELHPESQDDSTPPLNDAYRSFQEIKFGFDEHAIETKAANFWDEVYPNEARLVLAYVVGGFAGLGCDMNTLHPSSAVPEIQALSRHERLRRSRHKVKGLQGIWTRLGRSANYSVQIEG
jgi:hypothetical protein